jgi:hypothetical protein
MPHRSGTSFPPIARRLLAAGIGVVVLALSTSAEAARPAADLVAKRPVAGASVQAGGRLPVRVAIHNAKGAAARPSKTAVLLSRDARATLNDMRLGTLAAPALKGGKSLTLRGTLRVPSSAAGQWTVIACADSEKRVRERREDDNCAASRRKLEVTPRGSHPATPAPGEPSPSQPQAAETDHQPQPADQITPVTAGPGPRTVAVHVDEASGITRAVGDAGAVLTLDHMGRTFTLTIPPGALAEEQPVSMHPVTAIDDYPFSNDDPAAVQLEPEGLRLLEPAVLEISPPPEAEPGMRSTTFAWHGDGEEFHLHPLMPDPGRFALEISHFSGYGTDIASVAELHDQRAHTPTSPDDAAKQELEDPVTRSRECEQAGGGCAAEHDALQAEMKAVMLASYPRLIAAFQAAKTDEAGEAAIADAVSWMRMNALYSLGLSGESAALESAIENEYAASYDRAWARCRSADTAPAALNRLIAVARAAQVISYGGLDESRLTRCIQHRVSFESSISEDSTSIWLNPYGRQTTVGAYTTKLTDALVGLETHGVATPVMTAQTTMKTYQGFGEAQWQSGDSTAVLGSVDTAKVLANVSLAGSTAVPRELVISVPTDGVTVQHREWLKSSQDSAPLESTFTSPWSPWTAHFALMHDKEFSGTWNWGDTLMRAFRLQLDENGRWSAEREKKNIWGQEASGGLTSKSSATVTFAGGT